MLSWAEEHSSVDTFFNKELNFIAIEYDSLFKSTK